MFKAFKKHVNCCTSHLILNGNIYPENVLILISVNIKANSTQYWALLISFILSEWQWHEISEQSGCAKLVWAEKALTLDVHDKYIRIYVHVHHLYWELHAKNRRNTSKQEQASKALSPVTTVSTQES